MDESVALLPLRPSEVGTRFSQRMRWTTALDGIIFLGGIAVCGWSAACGVAPDTTAGASAFQSSSISPWGVFFISLAAWLLSPLITRTAPIAIARALTKPPRQGGLDGLLKSAVVGPVPIVFSPQYDITAGGIEKLHPFDSTKYSRVLNGLIDTGVLKQDDVVRPPQLPLGALGQCQTLSWLTSIGFGARAMIALEVPLVFLPGFMVWWRVLEGMQRACAGTVCSVDLAIDGPGKWAINLAGGYHHARRDYGHGFCVHNDLTMAIEHALWKGCERVLYVDLDVHQGDGVEWDCGWDPRVSVVDAFRAGIFPRDVEALDCPALVERGGQFHHPRGSDGRRFMLWLKKHLPLVIREMDPDLIVYNAGTDILDGDPLGGLRIPAETVIKRDLFVFQCSGVGSRGGPHAHPASAAATAFANSGGKVRPIIMTLSGGYQSVTASVISRSIARMNDELGLWGEHVDRTE
jgi:histone deacetylase 11